MSKTFLVLRSMKAYIRVANTYSKAGYTAAVQRHLGSTQMAMDLLSIPSMSSENERAFSQAKLVVTSQRHRLHYTTLNKLVCLKAWNKDGTFLEGWGN